MAIMGMLAGVVGLLVSGFALKSNFTAAQQVEVNIEILVDTSVDFDASFDLSNKLAETQIAIARAVNSLSNADNVSLRTFAASAVERARR